MTTDTVGGVWTYALELAGALAERNVETTLAAMGPRPREDQLEEASRAGVEVSFGEFALEWMPDPWDDLDRASRWLLELRDRMAPDLVHLNAYAHVTLPWHAPVLAVGHSCVLSWYEAVRREPAGPAWGRYRELVEENLAAADLVVAPTRWMMQALERHYELRGPRLVIANGRRARHLQVEKQPLVASAGRPWDEAKNSQALARVAARLPWPVAVAGDGAPTAAANLRPLGRLSRSRLDLLLAHASIFALPARYEPFGFGPLEAALAGCALILGDIPSLREVWEDAAFYVDPEDEEALHAALHLVIEEPELRAELAWQAYARAQWYTRERMADAYLLAYSRALARERTEAVLS
jgi:glycosyltransferase involved in cell wall biosynthesis